MEGFMEIAEDSLSHSRWIAISNAVGKGAFHDEEGIIQFILEDKTRCVEQKGQSNTPFKHPRFGLEDFDLNTLDAGELNEQRWEKVEYNFKMVGIRLLDMKGDLGKPPAVRTSYTLWEGVQSLGGNVTALSNYIKEDLAEELRLVTKMAESSSAVTKKAKLGVDNLSLLIGQNMVVALTAKVKSLEGHIRYLHNLVTESGFWS